jgi:hypothetical protein
MIKKITCLFACAIVALSVSCKREEASKLVDDNSASIPPARPDTLINPEPNIGPPPETNKALTPAPPADGKYPEMTFATTKHDFGLINQGDRVTYSFSFKNTGKADLIITSAKGSCGCTIPQYPKEPIKPGASGKIEVSFNSSGKHGEQHKSVTLTTNTAKGQEMLNITASINDKANQ